MFILDDALLSPISGILWVFREIHNAAQQELANEGESITTALSELYMMLETGSITESEFESQEKELLDRLDALQSQDADQEEADVSEEVDDDHAHEERGFIIRDLSEGQAWSRP